MNNEELKIIMVAPRRVGKTSLLAAMHEEFDKTFAHANLDTWTSDITLSTLQECKRLLRNIDPRLQNGIQRTRPSANPWDDEGLIFEIGSGGKKFMKLRFTDPSGEYFAPNATPEQKEYIEQQLNECDAVVVPIDATALMETKIGKAGYTEVGTWHEEKNAPSRITTLLKNAYSNLENTGVPRLIVLAPIKCETYMRKQEDANNLLNHVQIGYRDLLSFLKNEQLINKVAVVVTPVQTIGNVVFAYHETDPDNFTRFYYHKTPITAPYAPQDGDQPLRYILRFLINVYLDRKRKILKEETENLENLKEIVGIEQDDVKLIEEKLDQAKSRVRQREETVGLFRGIANWWDGLEVGDLKKNSRPDVIHREIKSQYQDAKDSFEKKKYKLEESQDVVTVTESQISAFNNALLEFSKNCKNNSGFATLQGFKWLSKP